MNWMLWTTLMAAVVFMLRFAWHYRKHFHNSIDRTFHWTRQEEYQGPPLSLSFRYRDGNRGPWRMVSANIVEVVRYGDGLFLKGREAGSPDPRVYRLDSLKDLREQPLGMPVTLDALKSRMKPLREDVKPRPAVLELPAIYRQA